MAKPRTSPAKKPAPRAKPKPTPLAGVVIGPTWQRDARGDWLLPEYTLGWQILGWTAEYLRQPDGPDAGNPWCYTDEQARFILWWYALDEQGRWLYRGGMLRRVKGWGKDPVAATLCAVEFVGPCRFDGWDANGDPVAKEHPAAWILTAAVAKDQTRNTMTLFPGLFADAAINEFRIDLGKEIIYARGGRARLEAVTSSPRALEGPRSTFTLKNETQHWLANNDGHEMAKVIARNATKSRDGASRVLAISNAHEPGENSDAELDYEAWQAINQGKSRSTGFLYDSLETPPDVQIAPKLEEGMTAAQRAAAIEAAEQSLRAGLRAARGDSIWLDEDRHVEEIYDPRNSVATSRRFYLNQIVAAEDAWIAPHEWDVLAADPPIKVADKEDITLGLDPSKTDDHTVLMGCRVSDGYVFTLGIWDPAEHGDELPRDELDDAVQAAFGRFNVLAFFSDLHPLESYVDKWAEEHGKKLVVKATAKHPIAWDMRGRQKETTIEIERLHDEIVEVVFNHDGNPAVGQHFHNARRRPNAWGVSVGKEHRESTRKIDSVPSVMLARTARRLSLEKRKPHYRSAGFH